MLKHLNIDEMVALIEPWVDKTRLQPTFLSIPEVAPLHGKVMQAWEVTLAVRPKLSTSPELAALDAEAQVVDTRHDSFARGVSFTLEAHAAFALAADPPDPARASHCREVAAKLFPAGLSIVNASWLAESGNTARVARLIQKEDPTIAQLLTALPGHDKSTTLLDTVEAWIATGSRLAELEHARTALLAKEATKTVNAATVQTARAQWFRVVSLVLSALEITDAPAEAVEAIRGPVLRASERAEKRYAKTDGPTAPEAGEQAESTAQGGNA